MNTPQSSVQLEVRSSFEPAAMGQFALRPVGSAFFRAQHAWLQGQMELIEHMMERADAEVSRADALVQIGHLASNLQVHTQFEVSILLRSLVADARARLTLDQLEGEAAAALAELRSIQRRQAASPLAGGQTMKELVGVFTRLRDIMRREERAVFPSFDRATYAGASATPAA